MRYGIKVTPKDGKFEVTCRDIPECVYDAERSSGSCQPDASWNIGHLLSEKAASVSSSEPLKERRGLDRCSGESSGENAVLELYEGQGDEDFGRCEEARHIAFGGKPPG